MKAYRTRSGIILESDGKFYRTGEQDWDRFMNDDGLFQKAKSLIRSLPAERGDIGALLPPIGTQEVWAAGVTYYRSKVGREEESRESGAADFYARVYEAERPELFFKSTASRVVGHGDPVRIRRDSTWNVPEPELTLMITSSGRIVGYTIGNDMSSRSIEGENPLYLPQAKCYDKSAAVGPCILITDDPLPPETEISIEILRGKKVFDGSVRIDQIRRGLPELVEFLFRETSFQTGCLLMTGTGIVPSNEFTLQAGDEIRITINGIGTLINTVETK